MKLKTVTLVTLCLTGAWLVNSYAEEMPAEPAARNESRSILVTYVDKTLARHSVFSSGRRYHARGQYKRSVWGRRIARKISTAHQLILVSQWPVTELGVYCVVYQVPQAVPLDLAMESLREDSIIESVQAMNHFQTMAKTYNDPYFKLQDNIHRMQIEAAQFFSTGANIRIAVIDTGIDRGHIDLAGQILSHQEFLSAGEDGVSGHPESHSYDVHGTAVAGVIGAIADNETGIVGVSPGAKLIALKACQASERRSLTADCTSFSLAKALNTAIRMKPDIINMSLAGPPDPLLHRLIDHALDKRRSR